jgi:hypothetical protein
MPERADWPGSCGEIVSPPIRPAVNLPATRYRPESHLEKAAQRRKAAGKAAAAQACLGPSGELFAERLDLRRGRERLRLAAEHFGQCPILGQRTSERRPYNFGEKYEASVLADSGA